MKINRIVRLFCLALILTLLLTSCSMFRRTKKTEPFVQDGEQNTDKEPSEEGSREPITPEENPMAKDPTPEELIANMMAYDFDGTPVMVAVPESCALFAEGTDSNAVLATVLEAIQKKYNTEVIFAEYDRQQMFLQTEAMVNEGAITSYFTDVLILSATEYARYRNAGLLERLEMIPFLNAESECFDSTIGKLFKDESGTYGVVGYGSQLFKNQITVFVNPALLQQAGITFEGYPMVKDGSWDLQAFATLLQAFAEKTGKEPLASVLSEQMNENLFAALQKNAQTQADLPQPYAFGQNGRDEFMLGKVPVLIGVLSDVERMYQALNDYRMLPIPYKEDGKYETFYDMESVYVFCVPKGNTRTDCTGIFINAFHTASRYLPYSYFQQFLLEKYVRDEGTLRVIALVGKTAKYLPEAEDETEE
ncbi:MAG: hypothetical protein E7599_02760 [Ruminococcaceae bacterium]|nr:hypothetical protein [Oscillospiraceae bacterium]